MRIFILVALLALPQMTLAQEIAPRDGTPLQVDKGGEIMTVYEAWLSPLQEGGEERDTPAFVPEVFRSTAPSVDRKDRKSRGHGTLAVTRDLGRAYAHVKIDGVNPEDITMFHIHCGRPGQLGPILIDLGLKGDLAQMFSDGELSIELTNEDITAVTDHSHGLIGAFTSGCPIVPSLPNDRVTTIAGLNHIAAQGELYFNLHTKGQVYFGDIRGQLLVRQ